LNNIKISFTKIEYMFSRKTYSGGVSGRGRRIACPLCGVVVALIPWFDVEEEIWVASGDGKRGMKPRITNGGGG
jgi:hypothetical protein